MAMTGQKSSPRFGGIFPQGGYGLYFKRDWDHYILFADCDGDKQYDESGSAASCGDASPIPNQSFPEMIAEIYLEDDVVISNVVPYQPGLYYTNVTFFPPDPIITIDPPSGDNQVVFTLSLGGKQKTVTLNTVGLIDID